MFISLLFQTFCIVLLLCLYTFLVCKDANYVLPYHSNLSILKFTMGRKNGMFVLNFSIFCILMGLQFDH